MRNFIDNCFIYFNIFAKDGSGGTFSFIVSWLYSIIFYRTLYKHVISCKPVKYL